MSVEYKVQKAGLFGDNWTTVFTGQETKAREILLRQLRLYSVGRFRLVDPNGRVVDERKTQHRFSLN